MKKKLQNNSQFRIVIKNNPSDKRSSSMDSSSNKENNNSNFNNLRFSAYQNRKNEIFATPQRQKSVSNYQQNIQKIVNKKHLFSSNQPNKLQINDKRRRLALKNKNIIKPIIGPNTNSIQFSDSCTLQCQNVKIQQFYKQDIKNSMNQESSSDKHTYCQNDEVLWQYTQNPLKQMGIQTQKLQYQKQSYIQYLKFKMTKKQKYEKIQNLFDFFDKLSSIENQNFINFNQGFNKQQYNKKLYDQRQKRIQQLRLDYLSSYSSLCQQFKNNIIEFNKTRIQQLLRQNLCHSYNKFYKKYIIKIKKQIFQNIQLQPQISSQVQKIFLKMEHDIQSFNQFIYAEFDNIKSQIKDVNNKLQRYFKIWENKLQQYTTIIRNCVMSISKMPQMCSIMFGFGQSKDHDKTNDLIKKFGVDINKIPNISDFFTRKDTQNVQQIDKAFSKCCEIKCMNCVYLRSKMKYIYMKNIQLQPIKKALINLTQKKSQITKKFQFLTSQQNYKVIANKKVIS